MTQVNIKPRKHIKITVGYDDLHDDGNDDSDFVMLMVMIKIKMMSLNYDDKDDDDGGGLYDNLF